MNLEELFKSLQAEYLKTFEEKISNLKKFLSLNDFEKIEMEFHKMKGTGSTHNIPEISELGHKMEDYIAANKEADPLSIEESISVLENIVKSRNEAKVYQLSSCPSYNKLVKKIS